LTKNIRRQLTLFVDSKDAEIIEAVRQEFNPVQFRLIKSHVTLCREDEIENLEKVISNLYSLTQQEIVIEFGKAVRFDNGKGLLLPAITDNIGFQDLRRQVLIGLNDNPRKHEAHITLMHPGNSTCTDAIFHHIEKLSLPKQLSFKKISLIEQEDGGQWNILQEFEFRKKTEKTT
jgi:2'-5' RNA ligase